MLGETTQVKVTVDSDTVAAFKSRCAREGVSMTSVIRQLMESGQPAENSTTWVSTRPQRRKSVLEIIVALGKVLIMEEQYRDNIPEQFEQRYEAADHACGQLEEAIACLEDAFQ